MSNATKPIITYENNTVGSEPITALVLHPLPTLPDCYAHHRRDDGTVRNPRLKARFKKGSKR